VSGLGRRHDRRRVHHGSRTPASAAEFALAIASTSSNGASADAGVEDHEVEVDATDSLIVRDKTHEGIPMTTAEALHEMELVGHDFFLFADKESGLPSVVYRRHGYDYGVIRLATT
jgi:hypothetical protein